MPCMTQKSHVKRCLIFLCMPTHPSLLSASRVVCLLNDSWSILHKYFIVYPRIPFPNACCHGSLRDYGDVQKQNSNIPVKYSIIIHHLVVWYWMSMLFVFNVKYQYHQFSLSLYLILICDHIGPWKTFVCFGICNFIIIIISYVLFDSHRFCMTVVLVFIVM